MNIQSNILIIAHRALVYVGQNRIAENSNARRNKKGVLQLRPARADAEFALRLATDLRSAGVDLWIDQLDIPAGAQWDRAVKDALEACSCLLLILSPKPVDSQNVMDEASFAIDQDKKIFPVLYQDCDIPFRLRRLQYIDFSGDYDIAYTKLLNDLRTHSPENAETPSPKLRSTGLLLDSASISADKVEQGAGLATRKKEGKPWWRHPTWIGSIAVIIAAVLSSLYLLITNGDSLRHI
jgi:hypothetical protein